MAIGIILRSWKCVIELENQVLHQENIVLVIRFHNKLTNYNFKKLSLEISIFTK